MRTHIEFISSAFPAYPEETESINPERYGKRLAEYLSGELPQHGFAITGMNAEDWGWRIDLENSAFPLWIGCGNYPEFENGYLCFIEPAKPFVRKFFKKIPTEETVGRLADALQITLERNDEVRKLRWWTNAENV